MLNKNDWTYHPPTEVTGPKYAAIRAAAEAVEALATKCLASDTQVSFDEVNEAVYAYAQVVDREAPDSANKTAAIRCCQLARNALNESLVMKQRKQYYVPVIEIARGEIVKARWQACAAVALAPA